MSATKTAASWISLFAVFAALLGGSTTRADSDWPMLRGGPAHTGLVRAELKPPFFLSWAREIPGERLGTAMEPIVAGSRLFIATHKGNLYALRADTGEGLWRFHANGPFLHSPASTGQLVLGASQDGNLYAVEASTGKLRWSFEAGDGGFSAAPIFSDGCVFIGTRAGDMLALSLQNGNLLWRKPIGFPVRQTAAASEGKVYVTAEDLRLRCFVAGDGKLEWTSEPFCGQTARDYYPVVIKKNGRTFVIVRTNPVLNMGQRIARDRTLLCRNAGVDDSNWQKLDAWTKSAQAQGDPKLWSKENKAIEQSLQADPWARSFFVIDGSSGKEISTPPIFWVGGCQGVGPEPALTAEGKLLVQRRSAYGNWNLGVAPFVALGLLDLENNSVTPLFHSQGTQPPWNCFWGTADESQNFLVAGDTVLIIHQGTLSGFNRTESKLFPIWGERDTYGGFANPPWARNEWHGPARAGVAVVGNRIYWQTGSRILCVSFGQTEPTPNKVEPLSIGQNLPSEFAPKPIPINRKVLLTRLIKTAEAVLSREWAPLFTDPGLAGRVFCFDQSGELFESLARAFPHLPKGLQDKTRQLLANEWQQHPPFTRAAWYSLTSGARREWFSVPPEVCARLGSDKLPHPFGNMFAVWTWAENCNEQPTVLQRWPELKDCFDDFINTGWQLNPVKGDLFANRYLASLLAFSQIAQRAGDSARAQLASRKAETTATGLCSWWRRAAGQGTLRTFNKSSKLDPFIKSGDALFFAMAPHRHKLALFQDLTPEVAELLRARVPESIDPVIQTFSDLCPTWSCTGEERQVHFGENFIDSPDFALSAFRAFAWLRHASTADLTHQVDLPFCRADLYYLLKLAIALESSND